MSDRLLQPFLKPDGVFHLIGGEAEPLSSCNLAGVTAPFRLNHVSHDIGSHARIRHVRRPRLPIWGDKHRMIAAKRPSLTRPLTDEDNVAEQRRLYDGVEFVLIRQQVDELAFPAGCFWV